MYQSLLLYAAEEQDNWRKHWKFKDPQRASFMLWLTRHERLPTMDRLSKFGIPVNVYVQFVTISKRAIYMHYGIMAGCVLFGCNCYLLRHGRVSSRLVKFKAGLIGI